MFTICSLYIHYIFTIYSLYIRYIIHYKFAIWSLYGHYIFTIYLPYIHYIFNKCSLYIQFTTCLIYVHYRFTIKSLFGKYSYISLISFGLYVKTAIQYVAVRTSQLVNSGIAVRPGVLNFFSPESVPKSDLCFSRRSWKSP